jgi:hypothetical protein
MSMKISNYTVGNRTRDLPACSAVPQTTYTQTGREVIIILKWVLKKYEVFAAVGWIYVSGWVNLLAVLNTQMRDGVSQTKHTYFL